MSNEQSDRMTAMTVKYRAGKTEISLSSEIVRNFLTRPTASGKQPSDQEVVKFMALCKARELNPWVGDAYLIGYDAQSGPEFSLITSHQALLKRAESQKDYKGMESGVIIKNKSGEIVDVVGAFFTDDDTLLGAWAKVYRKNLTNPIYKRIKLTAFNKGFGRWKIDPAGMIVKCAESAAYRAAFPNVVGDLYTTEEMPAAPRDITSQVEVQSATREIPTVGTGSPVKKAEKAPLQPEPIPNGAEDDLPADFNESDGKKTKNDDVSDDPGEELPPQRTQQPKKTVQPEKRGLKTELFPQ